MRVINSLEMNAFTDQKLVVALGNFDGVHVGHRQLLGEMVGFCRKHGAVPAVLLFHPHPQRVLDRAHAPRMLITLDQKLELLRELGVEAVFVLPFNKEFADLTPENFLKDILLEKLMVKGVFVGFNYRFGKGAAGTPELLADYGNRYDFYVHVHPPVVTEGQVISSTEIRKALYRGDIARARKMLGYHPQIRGTVVGGDRRGRTLGFPTANVQTSEELLLPAPGVYAGKGVIGGETYVAVLNIGQRPTFYEKGKLLVEAHLIDYHGNAYGEELLVELYRKLRDEQKFVTEEDLISQIKRDLSEAVRAYQQENEPEEFLKLDNNLYGKMAH